MSILLTGGTGFLGAHLARRLLEEGFQVVLLDVAPNLRMIADISERVEVARGDLTLWSDLVRVVRKDRFEGIYHLAAVLSAAAEVSPMAGFRVNFEGTVNVLEAARLFDVEKVVFTSSMACYGPGVPQPVPEDVPLTPRSSYGVAKVFGEFWGLYYHHQHGLNFRALRLPSVVGPGRGPGGASAYSTLMIQKPALGEAYDVEVEEDVRMPILYVKDAVRALLTLYKAGESRSRVYNIAGLSPTAREILETLKKYVPDAKVRFKPKPEISSLVRSWPSALDDRKAREELGWGLSFPLDPLVRDFVQEVRAKRHLYAP